MSADLDGFRTLLATQLTCTVTAAGRHLRGLSKADHDDVLSAALLDAWESRKGFNPAVLAFDEWFAAIVGAARQRHRRQERRGVVPVEAVNHVFSGGTDSDDERRRLLASMTPKQRAIAKALRKRSDDQPRQTWLRQTAKSLDVATSEVAEVSARVRRVSGLAPDRGFEDSLRPRRLLDSDHDMRPPARIDQELGRLPHRSPDTRADCPVCGACCWFAGLIPDFRQREAEQVGDAEVRAAMDATKWRKAVIAARERREVENDAATLRSSRLRRASVIFEFPLDPSDADNLKGTAA